MSDAHEDDVANTPLTPPSPSNAPSPIFFAEDYNERMASMEARNLEQEQLIVGLQKQLEEAAAEKEDLSRRLKRAEQQLQSKQLETAALSGALSVSERLNGKKAPPSDEGRLQATVKSLQEELSALKAEREDSEGALALIQKQMDKYEAERTERPPRLTRRVAELGEKDRGQVLDDAVQALRSLAEAARPAELDNITTHLAALLQHCGGLRDGGRAAAACGAASPARLSRASSCSPTPQEAHSSPSRLSTSAASHGPSRSPHRQRPVPPRSQTLPPATPPVAFSPLSVASTATAAMGRSSSRCVNGGAGIASPPCATPSPAPPPSSGYAGTSSSRLMGKHALLTISLDSLVMRGAKVKPYLTPQRAA
eukprot:TRINITY_DN30330_c0_g1_i1.p1 TRINITY_DN30330_c0_g1~~TRINITY_DN30330_c0_g1_i1.p1  ORF type:complete len:367 (+),score=91.62 TRINITY_DN30330_c0_g1_i1:128-1228(+)